MLRLLLYRTRVAFSSSADGGAAKRSRYPEAPDASMCCGSGCQQCVWVKYGEELLNYYEEESLDKALKELTQRIDNPAVRVFVEMQLRDHKAEQSNRKNHESEQSRRDPL